MTQHDRAASSSVQGCGCRWICFIVQYTYIKSLQLYTACMYIHILYTYTLIWLWCPFFTATWHACFSWVSLSIASYCYVSPEKKHPAMQCKRCCVSENCLANDIDVEQGALFFVRFVQVLSWHRIVFSCNYLINFKTLSHVFLSVLFSFVRTVEKIMCWTSNCASRLLYSRL